MLKKTTWCLATPFGANNFAKQYRRGARNATVRDTGRLSSGEVGDTFTDPNEYRSRNLTAQLRVNDKIRKVRGAEQRENDLRSVKFKRAQQIDVGAARARSPQEQALSDAINERDLGLKPSATSIGGKRASRKLQSEETEKLRKAIFGAQHRNEEQQRLKAKYDAERMPTSTEFNALFRQLKLDEEDEHHIAKLQDRLVEDHGIYPMQRLESFMMSDDSVFPDWVAELPTSVRDRVKYGGVGLSEHDMVTRMRLANMPVDERQTEWGRLKAAREYEEGAERELSHAELRDARLGKRRYRWLQKRRQWRAAAMKRLALRKPEKFEATPSNAVDYSKRFALIAQYVEAGISTEGKWPLDREELAKAKIRKAQEADKMKFVTAYGGSSLGKGATRGLMARKGNVAEAIDQMEAADADELRPQKKISQKKYAHRVNNVVQGVADEKGRNFKKIQRMVNSRGRNESTEEQQLHKVLRSEPRPEDRSGRRERSEMWSRSMKKTDRAYGLPNQHGA